MFWVGNDLLRAMALPFARSRSAGGAPPQKEHRGSDDPSSAPGKLRLSLPSYWTVMVLVVVFLREHLRRTEGLVLRRIKTFCLAGTAIFTLKMTRKLTKVSDRRERDERKGRKKDEGRGGGKCVFYVFAIRVWAAHRGRAGVGLPSVQSVTCYCPIPTINN